MCDFFFFHSTFQCIGTLLAINVTVWLIVLFNKLKVERKQQQQKNRIQTKERERKNKTSNKVEISEGKFDFIHKFGARLLSSFSTREPFDTILFHFLNGRLHLLNCLLEFRQKSLTRLSSTMMTTMTTTRTTTANVFIYGYFILFNCFLFWGRFECLLRCCSIALINSMNENKKYTRLTET